jgi:flavodoxin
MTPSSGISMKKVIIVYESVYGNTKKVAEEIADGINEYEGAECVIRKTGEIHTDDLCEYDAILFGCPNHNQEPARNLLIFIDRASIVHLEGKVGAIFDTYTGGNKDVAVTKLESKLRQKMPGIVITEQLSCKVAGRKGPLAEGEESRARAFGVRFGSEALGLT